ncbi:MAG: PAS domain S-box protein [Candidatus Binatia bacterium]
MPALGAAVTPATDESIEAELRRSREQYEHLVASIDGIVWEANGETLRFTFVSAQAERLLGYPPARWVEDPDFWCNHIHPDDCAWVVAFCRRSTEERKNHDFEYRMIAADGRAVWLRDIVTVVEQPSGPLLLRGVMVDITAAKQRDEDLRAAEERFRHFVENLNDVVYALDRSGNFLYCSPAIEQVSSYTPAEVLGRSFADFVHVDDLPALAAVFQRNLAGESAQVEYRVHDKNGEIRWVHASIGPTIENGEVTGVTGVFSEITARKRTLEALYESEARYRELVEMSPNSIVVHRGGKIVFANGSALRLVGASDPSDLLGHPLLELVHESSRALAIERIRSMTEEGKPAGRVEEVFLRLDGTTIDVEVMASPIVFHGQSSIQVIIDDVTERRRIREEVHRLNAELEQRVRDRTAELVAANRELEAFSYSVSHDLRAPLRVIEGFAKMFLEEYSETLDEQGRSYLHRIHSTSARMDRLIHDLLAFSRMSRASMTVEKVDLSAIARSVVEDLEQERPVRDTNFVIADGLVVEGDEPLLRIVVENLIGNAWKYTSRRPTAVIEFGSETIDGERVYFVRDDGVGFDMQFVGKLFRPFQRLHAIGDFEGTGIGLATVQRIIERHGGRVWADSEVDEGTTFRFTLWPKSAAPARRASATKAGHA